MGEAGWSSEDLALARQLVCEASEIALRCFGRDVGVERKPDGSEVTKADVEVERHLVDRLAAARPGDGVLGEELGASGPVRRRWILDPIDGTSNFIRGARQWGTHVALQCQGEIVLGAISRPLPGKHWWASRGAGAFEGPIASPGAPGRRLRVSTTRALAESVVAVWAEPPHAAIDRVRACATLAVADLDAILKLVEGGVDAVIDLEGRIWDHAPATVLVEEAGGRYSDREGGRRIDRGEVRYTNGLIHHALARALAG